MKSKTNIAAGQIPGFPPPNQYLIDTDLIMATKVIAKASTATSTLEKHNRLLKRKLESEIGEKNHEADQRRKIHNMLFKTQAAIQDEKTQEMRPAVSFYAARKGATIWSSMDTDVQKEYFATVKGESFPVVRKSHYAFLPPGVDIRITIRDSTANQHVELVLRQIADAIHNDPDIAYCTEDDDSLECQVDVVNGILLAE